MGHFFFALVLLVCSYECFTPLVPMVLVNARAPALGDDAESCVNEDAVERLLADYSRFQQCDQICLQSIDRAEHSAVPSIHAASMSPIDFNSMVEGAEPILPARHEDEAGFISLSQRMSIHMGSPSFHDSYLRCWCCQMHKPEGIAFVAWLLG